MKNQTQIYVVTGLLFATTTWAANPALPKIESSLNDMNSSFSAVKDVVQKTNPDKFEAADCEHVKTLEKAAEELFTAVDGVKTEDKKLKFKLSLFRPLAGVFVEDVSPLSFSCEDEGSAPGAARISKIVSNLNTELSKMNERFPELKGLLSQ